MPASGDCELITTGFWGQPVNAISSLALVVIGIGLLRRRPVLGWLAVAAGIGSFLYHGPMPSWSEWAHDTTLAGLLIGLMLETRAVALLRSLTLVGVGFAVFPAGAEPVTLLIAVAAAIALVVTRRPRWPRWRRTTISAGTVLLVAGSIGVLSRSGGPLCSPESLVQGHAFWHVGAAIALWLYGSAVPGFHQPSVTSTAKDPSE